MAGYLLVDGFRSRTVMPPGDVDRLEQTRPGYLQSRLDLWSATIDARLRKRYAVPFDSTSPPITILGWLTDIVTFEGYMARGWNPNSEQDALIAAAYVRVVGDPSKNAKGELQEAADSETGLYDLPVRADTPTSAISQGGPFGYSEQSPYTWMDVQRQAVRNGSG